MRFILAIGLGTFFWWGIWILVPVSEILFPNPFEVLRVLARLGLSADFLDHLLATILRTGAGLSIGITIGVPLGITLGFHEPSFKIISPLVDFLRSIPAVTLFPLISLFAGSSLSTTILVTGVGVATMTVFYLAAAVYERPRALEDNIRDLGASERFLMIEVILPQMRQKLSYTVKQGFGLALVVTLVGEMFVGSEKGLGQLLILSHMSYRIPDMYAVLVCIGGLGSIGTLLIDHLTGRVRNTIQD